MVRQKLFYDEGILKTYLQNELLYVLMFVKLFLEFEYVLWFLHEFGSFDITQVYDHGKYPSFCSSSSIFLSQWAFE